MTHPADLRPREREICALILGGWTSTKELANALNLSDSHVKSLVTDMMRLVGVETRAGLAAWATLQEIAPTAPRPRRSTYYLARFMPLPPTHRGHASECACSVCYVHGRQNRRAA